MVLSINGLSEPIGSLKSWLRPNASTPLPSGWLICDGSTVVDASSPYNGTAIPDMRNRFLRGHGTLTNVSFPGDVTYFAGGTIPVGGVDSNNVNHAHGVSGHSHGIPNSGTHSHSIPSQALSTGPNTFPSPSISYPPPGPQNWAENTHTHPIPSHDHGGTQGGGDHNHGGTSSNGDSIFSALGSIDNTPGYRGLVFIIKIK